MTDKKFDPHTGILLSLISATALLRVVFNFNHNMSPLANFSPLGAMAVFGGAYFNHRVKAFSFPLLILFISDFILQQTVFKEYSRGFLYGGWYWVYGAFTLMVITGRFILIKIKVNRFLLSVLACVFIHWTVTDIGVWLGSTIYSQDLKGYLECLTAAIPFEWRFLAGTLAYGIILFGSFEWIKKRYVHLQIAR